uniref:INVERT_DEFENSINS domain-containing protein n=1 Tax=Rhabditophanes sp. KR3021 TaxID=114890 RepID=A0AC35U2W4_9BILA
MKFTIISILFAIILYLAYTVPVEGLCANAGRGCHDTGCRLHGGACNSACQCVQRQGMSGMYSQCIGFGSF